MDRQCLYRAKSTNRIGLNHNCCFGGVGYVGIPIDHTDFYNITDTLLQLDIFFDFSEDAYPMVLDFWEHSEVIGTLPADSYILNVRAFEWPGFAEKTRCKKKQTWAMKKQK